MEESNIPALRAFNKLNYVFKSATKNLSKEELIEQLQDHWKNASAFVMFVMTGIAGIAYYSTVHRYRESLVACENLKEFMANPNSRVASNKQAEEMIAIAEQAEKEAKEQQSLLVPDVTAYHAKLLGKANGNVQTQQDFINALIA